jgi:hypothetical protein
MECPSRPRVDLHPTQDKLRFELRNLEERTIAPANDNAETQL